MVIGVGRAAGARPDVDRAQPKLKARAGALSATATAQPSTGVAALREPVAGLLQVALDVEERQRAGDLRVAARARRRVCLLQTATAWKMATMPISPIATPTRISTSDRPQRATARR